MNDKKKHPVWRDWLAFGWRTDDAKSPSGSSKSGAVSPRGLLVLILLGVGLMVLAPTIGDERNLAPTSSAPSGPAVPVQTNDRDYIHRLEREVTELITQIAGVDHAQVLIVPRSSEVKVLAEEVTERLVETEGTDTSRGVTRETNVTRRPVFARHDGSRSEEPVVLFTKTPEIAGVLVVAAGAEDPRVHRTILKAVSVALDLPPHRVEIAPRK